MLKKADDVNGNFPEPEMTLMIAGTFEGSADDHWDGDSMVLIASMAAGF